MHESIRAGVLVLTAATSSMAAENPQEWAWDIKHCFTSVSSVMVARACNAIIEAGAETPARLARAYLNRAGVRLRAYPDGGVGFDRDLDRAIADFSQAIRLDPTLADAFARRAGAWGGKGQWDRALADYEEAIRLTDNAMTRARYQKQRAEILRKRIPSGAEQKQ